MKRLIVRGWREQRLLTLAFLAMATLTILLVLRLVAAWIYFGIHRDLQIEPWMTLGYVARSHHASRAELFHRLGPQLGVEPGRRETVAEIAARTGLSEADVIGFIEAALAQRAPETTR